MISFNSIPNSLRTPGSYIEFTPRRANLSRLKKVLLIGYANTGEGDANRDEIYPVSSLDSARVKYGYTSMLARMTEAFKKAGANLDLHAIALTPPEAGVHAVGALSIDENAATASVFNLWADGLKVAIAIKADDEAATIAGNLASAINGNQFFPVTATATGVNVDLIAKVPDELGNKITLSTTLFRHKNKVAHTLTAMKDGAGTPDLQVVIDAMAETQYQYIVNPFINPEQLVKLTEEMDSRWGPMRQNDGRVFMAKAGSYDVVRDFGQSQNSPHFTTLGIFDSPTPEYMAATINCGVAASSLDIDPARPLQDMALPGFIAGTIQPTRNERNQLLYSGISTFEVEVDGECQLERQITMYQKNDAGFEDDAYLDIQIPETLSMIRWLQRYTIMSNFHRWKLAESTTGYGSGQSIVTPTMIRAELISLYENVFMYERGWVQDLVAYKEGLHVEIDDDDKDRVNFRDEPILVGQFRTLAGQVAFKP